jgi:YegS/Rv2252/BmrU family lipid kinase
VKRIIFIINGTKTHTKKLTEVLYFFSNSTFFSKVEVSVTQYRGHAKKIANESTSKFDYLIAVGGDGTLNEVINGINFSSKIIVGLLPFGTGNDFSRGQKLQLDAHFLFDLIKKNSYKNIDIGLVKGYDKESSINRRFINIADIGLGGYVSQKMMKNTNKYLSGKIKYALAILKGIILYSKPELKVEGDYNFQGRVLSLAICNGSFFGYGLCIAPEANIQNRSLNITCIGNVSLIDYFKNLRKIKKGELITHPEIKYSSIQKMHINHTVKACPIEVDGEFIGYTPVSIQMLPEKIKFLLP